MEAGLETVLIAMVAAALYAGTGFIKKATTDNFDWKKFTATVILGGIIGLAAALKGIKPDSGSIEVQLGLYAGATVIVENGIKAILRIARMVREDEKEGI